MKGKPPKLHGKNNGRKREVAAMLTASRALLEKRSFADAATAILHACKAILGADAGLVVSVPSSGKGFDLACLDPGNLALTASGSMPLPLRRLLTRAQKTGRAVIADDLAQSATEGVPCVGPEVLTNALVAPFSIADEVVGLVGLINKPGGFSVGDARLAEVFAEMAAVSMLNSRTVNGLEKNREALATEVSTSAEHLRVAEEKFKTLVENLPDMIARFDRGLRYLYASPAVGSLCDHPEQEFPGKTNRDLGLPPGVAEPWDAALRRVFSTGEPERLDLVVVGKDGTRHFDCRLIPELEPGGAPGTVLSVARDVTDKWLAYEAERRARYISDALREATVVLTRSLDRETVQVTLLDRLRRMVPFDRGSVMVLEEASRLSVRAIFDGARVLPLPPEERTEFDPTEFPVVQGILSTGTAILIQDLHAQPQWTLPTDRSMAASWMGVPLFARGSVAGLFSLSKQEAGYFNDEHVRLAEAMSSQASVAVENAVLFEQMQASTVRMRLLSRRLIEAQESERLNIARELHDEAGQALVSLRIGLRLLEREIEEGGSILGRVAELVERTDAVIEGLHRLAADLRPASLDHLGLEAALRQYSLSAASKFGLAVRFKARGFTGDRLPKVVETALYRVVQEAMTNIVRHARATQVDVLAQRRGNTVRVVVEDDGIGFEQRQVQSGESFGLLGMRERAEALGGTLTVESSPGSGTTVVVEVVSDDSHSDR